MSRLTTAGMTATVFAILSSGCSAPTSGSERYTSRLSVACKADNKPIAVAADADAKTVYAAYRGAVEQRRKLLDVLAAIPGPSQDVAAVRRGFLDPSYAELHQAQSVVTDLRHQAASRAPAVSEQTIRHMLRLATLEEPINDFLAARGLAACQTS